MKTWLICGCLTLGMLAGSACDDEDNLIEDTDEWADCADICDKYQECFDDDYNTDKCEDNCKDRADDADHLDQEEACSDCIDDMSCSSATFSCAADCLGIVP